MKAKFSGMTMLELLIVVAIIGILATIALPSWNQQVMKTRRSDAVNSLLDMQLLQGRYFAENGAYGSLAQIGGSSTSNDEYYSLAISGVTSAAFLGTATATGSQADDTDCAKFCINQDGPDHLSSGCATSACW